MMYKEKQNNTSARDLFSVGKNLSATRSSLELREQTKSVTQNVLEQKQILLVYVAENDCLYIKHSAAYALGLVETRSIMVGDTEKLVEISKMQLASISTKQNIEVKMERINASQKLPERQKIKVYKNDLLYYIDMSAAYALGLVSVETFNVMAGEFYGVSEALLAFLQNKYDVEYHNLEESIGGRK